MKNVGPRATRGFFPEGTHNTHTGQNTHRTTDAKPPQATEQDPWREIHSLSCADHFSYVALTPSLDPCTHSLGRVGLWHHFSRHLVFLVYQVSLCVGWVQGFRTGGVVFASYAILDLDSFGQFQTEVVGQVRITTTVMQRGHERRGIAFTIARRFLRSHCIPPLASASKTMLQGEVSPLLYLFAFAAVTRASAGARRMALVDL